MQWHHIKLDQERNGPRHVKKRKKKTTVINCANFEERIFASFLSKISSLKTRGIKLFLARSVIDLHMHVLEGLPLAHRHANTPHLPLLR